MTLNTICNQILPTKDKVVSLTKLNPNLSMLESKNTFGKKQMLEIIREVSNQTLNEDQNSR